VRCEAVHTLAVGLLWPLAAISTVGAVAGSLAPATAVPPVAPDYLMHFTGYAGIALVWLLAVVWCPGQGDPSSVHGRRIRAGRVLAAVIGMGAGLELAQHFVGRTAGVRDLVANTLGVISGWILWSRVIMICDAPHAARARAIGVSDSSETERRS